jgi:hypothetical protein
MIVGVEEDGEMASRIAKKIADTNGAAGKRMPQSDTTRSAPKARKVSERFFNAETAQALRDAEKGKNLTTYVDEDDLFRRLGIKPVGKAKA